MKLSKTTVKWMLNLFPPLLFNRIWISRISNDFMQMDVKVKHSLMNRNLNGTIFGGTIFSACDPYLPLMYWQIFSRKGMKVETWLKSAEIDYQKPSVSNLNIIFRLTDDDVAEAAESLKTHGRFKKWHTVELHDSKGERVAVAKILAYVRFARGKETSYF